MVALLLGCGLRRGEVLALELRSVQQPNEHWAIADLLGKAGRVWGNGMTPTVIWDVVNAAARRAGIEKLAPHDLRRTCARLCHLAGGELDQIQFLVGPVSIQTTERCLSCKQKLRCAANDTMGLEPEPSA